MTDKTVSHVIERGIDFVFANRRFCGNGPRLWEDFDLLLGPRDEWVPPTPPASLKRAPRHLAE
jgi:hypothetical protein